MKKIIITLTINFLFMTTLQARFDPFNKHKDASAARAQAGKYHKAKESINKKNRQVEDQTKETNNNINKTRKKVEELKTKTRDSVKSQLGLLKKLEERRNNIIQQLKNYSQMLTLYIRGGKTLRVYVDHVYMSARTFKYFTLFLKSNGLIKDFQKKVGPIKSEIALEVMNPKGDYTQSFPSEIFSLIKGDELSEKIKSLKKRFEYSKANTNEAKKIHSLLSQINNDIKRKIGYFVGIGEKQKKAMNEYNSILTALDNI